MSLYVRGIDGIGFEKPDVSSRTVGAVFGRRHGNVLRDIREAIETNEQVKGKSGKIGLPSAGESYFGQSNFIESTYKDDYDREQSEYLLARDSFVFIAMGFKGEEASEFKMAYINKYNKMKQYLINLNTARIEFQGLV